jgi:polysaccharide export outer membrane protein
MMRFIQGILATVAVGFISGCSTYNPSEELRQQAQAYHLKPLDPVTVILKGIPSGEEMLEDVIDENGNISLTYVGSIQAAGRTTSELEDAIERAYVDGEIYRQVNVTVTMYAKSYFIKGEVRAPGRYPLSTGTTLLQAIATASDFTEYANQKKIQLTRAGVNYWFDAKELAEQPEKDPGIKAGDLIEVHRSTF